VPIGCTRAAGNYRPRTDRRDDQTGGTGGLTCQQPIGSLEPISGSQSVSGGQAGRLAGCLTRRRGSRFAQRCGWRANHQL
jgi:hypothetical protein